jgi:hypothetical protein
MAFSDELDARSEDAYEALRDIANRSVNIPLPPAEVYAILGSLKRTPHLLPQVLSQLAADLVASLDEFEVTEHLDRDLVEGEEPPEPLAKILVATEHLMKAAKLCAQAGLELEKAQSAVSTQSHRVRAGAATDPASS